jgi:hypothetical protein
MWQEPDAAWQQTLAQVARRLEAVTEPWCVGASGALALHGLPLTPRDVDLFTTPRGVDQIAQALDDCLVQPPHWWDSPLAQSRFAAFDVDGVRVEVIGDLRPRGLDGTLATEPRSLEYGLMVLPGADVQVPVSPLPVLLQSYRLAQRPERVRQIEKFLRKEGS